MIKSNGKNSRKFVLMLGVGLLIVISAWIVYQELTRPTTPVITIEESIVSWITTGTGDIAEGRFIRSYELRFATERESVVVTVDGGRYIGEVLTFDLSTTDFSDINSNIQISVRTIRNLDSGMRRSRWSNVVVY